MKIKSYFIIVYSFLALFFVSSISCKTKKVMLKENPETTIGDQDAVIADNSLFLNNIILSKSNFEQFSFNAEADYKDDKQSATINIEVIAKKDQYVFLNAKAMGFINVARIMVQPDSIRILDLINRRYISASYKFMQQFSSAPIGFQQIQNLAMGNAIFDPKFGSTQIDSLGQLFVLITDLANVKQKSSYSKDLKTQSVLLSEQGKSMEMQVSFRDRRIVDGLSYPYDILINIQGEKKMECRFSIGNFVTSLKKEPQFVVPKSYKVQVF